MNNQYILLFSNMHPNGLVLKYETFQSYLDLLNREDRESVSSLYIDEDAVQDVLMLIESN